MTNTSIQFTRLATVDDMLEEPHKWTIHYHNGVVMYVDDDTGRCILDPPFSMLRALNKEEGAET